MGVARTVVFFVAALFAATAPPVAAPARAIIASPTAPWQKYRETQNDPDLGPSYLAYRLKMPAKQTQRLIIYRLFTVHVAADLGLVTQVVLKESYPDASFTQPHDVKLCGGLSGSAFSYTGDLLHDGHPTVTQEIIAQGTAMYAITYRRPVDQADDEQALRALHSFCPPRNEPLPTPPPFVVPSQFAKLLPPRSFHMIGQTVNSLAWYDPSTSGIIALRQQPTLFASVARFGAEQDRLAESYASTLNGFRSYTLVTSKPSIICATEPASGWYTEIRGLYYGSPSVAKQYFFIRNNTLYSAAYLHPVDLPDEASALLSLRSFCPRPNERPPTVRERATNTIQLSNALIVPLYETVIAASQMKYDTVWKSADEMPRYARYVAYAGRNANGIAILWRRRGVDSASQNLNDNEGRRLDTEVQTASLAAALDAGMGGSGLQSLVRRGPPTPEGLTDLAGDLFAAIARSSDRALAKSRETETWVADRITPGLSRQGVAALLADRGIKSITLVRRPNCSASDVATNWLYQGTYPDNQCAIPDRERRPVTSIELAGASAPGCSFSSYLDVLYDDKERVQQLVLGNPIPDCL